MQIDDPERGAGERAGGGLGLPLFVFAAAFLLYALTRRPGTFSDAVMLAQRVEVGATPNYNALYLPLGWAFHRGLQPLLGWDAFTALSWLSVLAGAASAALLCRMLQRFVSEPLALFGWCLLFLLAPGVWFFSASVEVHAIQLACVTFATSLAWRARTAAPGRAPILLALALWIGLLGHLTSVLLMPAWFLLALGDGSGRGLGWRRESRKGWSLAIGVSLALVAAVIGVFRSFGSQHKDPFEMFSFFAKYMQARFEGGGLFAAAEVADFLGQELVVPAGLLLLVGLIALFQRGDKRLSLAVLVAVLPYLVVLPFGGIRENGAYYLSLFPLFVLGAAKVVQARSAGHAAGLALVFLAFVQAFLGWRHVKDPGEDAREWAAELHAACPQGSVIYTSNLPRWHALSYVKPPFAAVDVWRVFEMMPASTWDDSVGGTVALMDQALDAGQHVFVDVDLFVRSEEQEGVRRLVKVFDEHFPARIPVPAEDPLVFEFVRE